MMADPSENAVALCNRFYAALDKSDLDGIMAVFAPDAVVEIGAGDSAGAVAYSGIFRGTEAIRAYYQRRLQRGENALAPVRPFCAFARPPYIFLPWVVFSGEIHDKLKDETSLYNGKFLHVWTVDPQAEHIAILGMFLEPAGGVKRPMA